MPNRYFVDPATLAALRAEPLGPVVQNYIRCLEDQRYSRSAILRKLACFRTLNARMSSSGLQVADLDDVVVAELLHLRAPLTPENRLRQVALQQLLAMLRDMRLIPTAPAPAAARAAPFQGVLDGFVTYLKHERGVTETTVSQYASFVREFLEHRCGADESKLQGLRLEDLTTFLLTLSGPKPGQVAHCATALRVLSRFLRAHGLLDRDLSAGLPRMVQWRLAPLPDRLTREEVDRLLRSQRCDTALGKRNLALLLLVVRLGLRTVEVSRLELDDVDWRAGTVLIKGKAGRQDRLPLPRQAGTALATYLRDVRPREASRRLFLSNTAPCRPMSRWAVSHVVCRAVTRCGVRSQGGAHLLRHSLAAELLHRGASMSEIGQVLRHTRASTTEIYAKVRTEALRQLACPWPEVSRS